MSKKDATIPLRELPQSIAAEAAILGSIIIDPPCFAEATELLCVEAFGYYENRDPKSLPGLSTGFYQLDEITSGLQNGDVIVIAARPSIGKTSLALNIIENMLLNEDVSVALFSLEMGGVQLAERMMCSLSRLKNQKVRRNHLDDKDYTEVADGMGRLPPRRLWIEEAFVLTPLAIRSRARRLKASHDIKCIVIDYLQLISTHGRHENRQQEITSISRSIKSLARELDVPVILLSQLNRAPANRSNFMPRLTDLRESDSIEQDADVVLLLHREDYYHKGWADYCNTNVADVIVAKQRNGPAGAIKLTFLPELSRFESYAMADGF